MASILIQRPSTALTQARSTLQAIMTAYVRYAIMANSS